MMVHTFNLSPNYEATTWSRSSKDALSTSPSRTSRSRCSNSSRSTSWSRCSDNSRSRSRSRSRSVTRCNSGSVAPNRCITITRDYARVHHGDVTLARIKQYLNNKFSKWKDIAASTSTPQREEAGCREARTDHRNSISAKQSISHRIT